MVAGATSLPRERADAGRLLALVRGHWHIENQSHWVRDVTFDEDRSQVRCGRSRHSIGRRRSSPNRNETRRISSDAEPSPNTSGRITTAARS